MPTQHCSSYSNQITQSLPRVKDTPKTEITNCFIHRIQLKTVKSLKVIWCLGCLSSLSAQVIILTSELKETMVTRSRNHNILLVEGEVEETDQIKSGSHNLIFSSSNSH